MGLLKKLLKKKQLKKKQLSFLEVAIEECEFGRRKEAWEMFKRKNQRGEVQTEQYRFFLKAADNLYVDGSYESAIEIYEFFGQYTKAANAACRLMLVDTAAEFYIKSGLSPRWAMFLANYQVKEYLGQPTIADKIKSDNFRRKMEEEYERYPVWFAKTYPEMCAEIQKENVNRKLKEPYSFD